jgi:hypothetical protein
MPYDFSTLSPADFEDLSRELIGRELGVRFEGFAAGPDGGIDGRHSNADENIILQAKHYAGSSFSVLKGAMRRERAAIESLAPERYILTTSRPLTPTNKADLEDVIGESLKAQSDIFGPAELNELLRKFPDVERAHIKLWLSSSAILERIVRSGAYSFTAASRAEIETKVRVYAQNPSFKEATDRLEAHHVLIISGPPGVGKTTLAEMLSYAYIGEEWEFQAIRSLDDGFAAIVDAKKQIFFFDDFLGKVALDARALSTKDSQLVKFIRRVRTTSNARFILTTRAYIFEEAKRTSEYIADKQLDITTYVLDVGVYTRRIKARILYNHLYVSSLPKENIKALVASNILPKIIDHRNYNPRIIEWMTDALNVKDIDPQSYAERFLNALDHPSRIWDTAFRTHIPRKCQHLLFALFFCSEYGIEIEDLELAFNVLHPVLCKKYGESYSTKDFGEAVKILEGSFIKISSGRISFINPSVRDYLTEYLKDAVLLSDLAPTAQTATWAKQMWQQFLSIDAREQIDDAGFVRRFIPAIPFLNESPVWIRTRHDPTTWRHHDLSLAQRVELYLEWWIATGDVEFIKAIRAIAQGTPRGLDGWRRGREIVQLMRAVKHSSRALPDLDEILSDFETALLQVIRAETSPDDLEEFYAEVDEEPDIVSPNVMDEANRSLEYQLEEMSSIVADVDSESTLDDHIVSIKKLGARISADIERLDQAIGAIQVRIEEVKERAVDADEPNFAGRTARLPDHFDDADINSLFKLLL